MEGRSALVTGAGRGIGRATALALADRGARVLGVARTESELEDLAREAHVEILAESLATVDGCVRVAEEARRRLGPIEILVNNAAVGSVGEKPIWEQSPDVWDSTMAVNLNAPFHLTRLLAPGMIERRFGRIVMVSSTAGQVGAPAMSAYCASKSGLLGLMRAVAQDLGPFSVTCNAVLPGWVKTEMADRKAEQEAAAGGTTPEEIWRERSAAYPAERVLTPEEVAGVIAFLASDEASGLSSEAITVALGGVW
jgi:NAD(P)-dependent dehydrogenase (short-subunit alcohol dehydrogenase family)